MSKKKKRVVSTKKTVVATPTVARRNAPVETSMSTELIFNRQNYVLMLIGAALIIVGMLLMTGGAQPDPNTWDADIIYSKRITLLGPVVIITGLIIEIVAIFKRS